MVARAVALAGLVAVAPATQGAGLQWSAGAAAGVEHTDNLNRTEQAQESASIATAVGRFAIMDQTRTLYADVAGVGTWRNFPTGIPGDDFMPAVDGFLMWTPVAERFSWRFTDNLGEIAPNSNGALAAANRERLNVASTGPDLQLPLGSTNRLTASGRYSRVDYQTSASDSDRVAGQVGVAHELELGSVVSLNAIQARTRTTATNQHFNVGSVYASYTQTGARGAIDANVGVTRLQSGSDAPTGAYADLRLARELTPQTSVALDLVHRYGDAAAVFSRQQDLEPDIGSIANVQSSGQPIRETAADVSLGWIGRRTEATLDGSYYRELQYGVTSATTERHGTDVAGTVEFKLRPDFTLGGDGVLRWWSDSVNNGARASELRGYLSWQFLSRLGVTVGAERYDQSHALQNYTETRYYGMLVWQVTRNVVTQQRPGFDTAARRRIQYGR